MGAVAYIKNQGVLALLVLLSFSTTANAVNFTLEPITPGMASDATLATLDINVEVTDAGGGRVTVDINNDSTTPAGAVLTQFFIQDAGGLLTDPLITLEVETDFNVGTGGDGPDDLVNPQSSGFVATGAFKSVSPFEINGLGTPDIEDLVLSFAGNYADVIQALTLGGLRFGANIGWLENFEKIDSVVTNGIPEPATSALLLGALGGLGFARRRKAA